MKKLALFLAMLLICFCVACGEGNDGKWKISEEKAMEIASQHWDIKPGDVDEETGFKFSIMVFHTPTEEEPYYEAALRWLVDNSHYSTVDEVIINAQTGECILP